MIAEPAMLRGELRRNEPLAGYTSWRVGGPADIYFRPADLADLAAFLEQLEPAVPLLWLGLGSNLLVRDGGFRGVVIHTHGRLNGLERLDESRIRAESGVPCAKVARFAGRHGLIGAAFLAGIPGTMGGALAMNAGAFGGETWERVSAVKTIDRRGSIRRRPRRDFEIGYRHVRVPEGEWFVAAELALEPGGDADALTRSVRDLLARRGASQPTGVPSCGSVFRNPAGDFAARLIEAAGLKGLCIGAACVSEKHANFILNTGGAAARDIEQLIDTIRRRVHDTHGVELVPEVHIVGEPS